jgi:predicted DNA-binding WGR domain protein
LTQLGNDLQRRVPLRRHRRPRADPNSSYVWIRLAGLGKFVRNWGRIGTNGLEIVEVFATEIEAEAVLEASARAKRRRGYGDL